MLRAHTNQWCHDEYSNPSYTEIIAALKAFICAPTWGETYHALEVQQAILLTDTTLTFLGIVIDQLHWRNYFDREALLEQYLQLLEQAHIYGISEAWQSFEKDREQELVAKMIAHLQDKVKIGSLLDSLLSPAQMTNMQSKASYREDEMQDVLPPDASLNMHSITQHCANPYFNVVDILERHQYLLEQAHTWNDTVAKWFLDELEPS